jgi:hypothetical protein
MGEEMDKKSVRAAIVATMDTIPECAYVIRKGEAPDPLRRNIYVWSRPPYGTAAYPNKFDPFLGPLPVLPARNTARVPPPPKVDDKEMRRVQITSAFAALTASDMTDKGIPEVESMRMLTGVADLGEEEIMKLWTKERRKK